MVAAALYFGRREDHERAKGMLRDTAHEALNLIYRHYPPEDFSSYERLGQVFAVARETENLQVTWWMMERGLVTEGVDDRGSTDSGCWHSAIVACYSCRIEFKMAGGIWVCLGDGGRSAFCEECCRTDVSCELRGPKLRKDKFRDCFHLVKDAKLSEVPKGSVLVADRVITLGEWEEEIRAKYVGSREDLYL